MTSKPFDDLARLSLNQYTTRYLSLPDAIDGCVRAGIPAIGLWRDKVAEIGLSESVRLIRSTGLTVSSLCRGGFFPGATAAERAERLADNRNAIDEAAVLGAETLVLVCGGVPDRDIAAARHMVEDGIAALLPYAEQLGVKLGIEPLHPMFAADRSVICSFGEANRLVERLGSAWVGVVIDAYHVWWDAAVYDEIARAAGHIIGFHVSDWLVPTPDMLMGRGMMGDGVIELRRLRTAIDQAGYSGWIEVEIFNRTLWDMPGDALLTRVKEGYLEHC